MFKRVLGVFLIGLACVCCASALRAEQIQQTKEFTGLNPQISLVGRLGGFFTTDTTNLDRGRFNFKEAELGIQSVVDPFSRADLLFAFENGAFDLEEGYLTLLALPGGWQAKLGRFFGRFGKFNTLHTHVYPFVEDLFFHSQLFGERLRGEGISLSHETPSFGDNYGEVVLEMVHDNATSFTQAGPNPIWLAHWRNFFELSDDAGLDTGITFVTGENPAVESTNITAVNAGYKWKPESNKWFLLQAEGSLSDAGTGPGARAQSSGCFVLATYRPDRHNEFGALWDAAQAPAGGAYAAKAGLFLVHNPSEFTYYKVQANQIFAPAGGTSEKQILFEVGFVMGPHRVHTY